MNPERVKRLRNEIKYLERQVAEELGYADTRDMRRAEKRALDHMAATKAGFKTVKAWKHALRISQHGSSARPGE